MWPQPIVRRMDDGVSNVLASLHGYGNAIVPQQAQVFIEAYLDTLQS